MFEIKRWECMEYGSDDYKRMTYLQNFGLNSIMQTDISFFNRTLTVKITFW